MSDLSGIGFYCIHSPKESAIQEEPMFWSNKHGWISFPSAFLFTNAERKCMNLPIGGDWMSYGEGLTLYENFLRKEK